MRRTTCYLTLALLVCGPVAFAEGVKDPLAGDPDLPNYFRFSPQIAMAGQPTPEGLRKVKDAGFKTILNLRTPREGSTEEAEPVEALGLSYINIPITPDSITDEKVARFSDIVNDPANKPLLIHCASSNRVGGMWYIHRAMVDHLDEQQGIHEARKTGLRSPILEDIVIEYVREKSRQP
ncbi:MAG: beta-lactamase hydrolase domain-containing protein [Acidobacteriota bacterium]